MARTTTTKRSPGASPLGATTNAGVTKRNSSSSGVQVSMALKTRRYIDININDVRNERARGKWTEEDEKLWRSTKPYECEICGERGSTRYNIENRHKVNRHFPQKVIPCPDCKLMFTRKDNLIKHQKKAHPELFKDKGKDGSEKGTKIKKEPGTSPKDERPQPENGDIDNMIRRFRTFFAPDVPPNPVAGLGKYYNPNKLPFLPPQLLTHYVDYYFDPSAFHNHVPFLHRASFEPKKVMASFLRAVCALGGLYDPTNKTLSGQLWESGWKVMERWIEKGLDDDDAEELRKAQARNARNGILPEEDNTEKLEREKQQRERQLCVLQGFLMFVFYGTFSADRARWTKAGRLHRRCVELAREHQYFADQTHLYDRPEYARLPLQNQWEFFIECESRKRVCFTLFLLDCHLAMLLNQPRLLRTSELKSLSFPCDDSLYEATTAEQWNAARQNYQDYEHLDNVNYAPHYSRMGKQGRTLYFWDIFRALLRGDDASVRTLEGARVNDFSAYILIMAIHMEILSLTQRVADEEEGDSLVGDKPIVFYPREKQSYIDKLRKALNQLGRISRFGPLLMTERTRPDEVMRCALGFNAIYDPAVQAAASFTPELRGCAKTFYIAWHLAHILLVVPDRMVLGAGDVPLDIKSVLRDIIKETKERLASNHTIQNEACAISWFENYGGGLEGHFYGIMRFLGRGIGIEDEYRSLEFPTATMMLFKALILGWEILVRANREESQVRSWQLELVEGVNWDLGLDIATSEYLERKIAQQWPNVAATFHRPVAQSLMGQTGTPRDLNSRATGDFFLNIMNEFIRLQEEMEGEEPTVGEIEVRYLRWVGGCFRDMECWDVGRVVVDVLEMEKLVESEEY